jgi:hypothetical protein
LLARFYWLALLRGAAGVWLKRHGKERIEGVMELGEGAVTVNQKTISRRTFPQLVHRGSEHKFFDFFVATPI